MREISFNLTLFILKFWTLTFDSYYHIDIFLDQRSEMSGYKVDVKG